MTENKNTIELNVEGMDCSNCAITISRYLEKEGLQDVSVNFATGEARFNLDNSVRLPNIIRGIEKLGYKVENIEDRSSEHAFFSVEKKFWFSVVFTLPLFLHMFLPIHILHSPYVQLALCSPVFVLGVIHFGKSAWFSIKNGVPNMDVLIFMGFTSAYIYSLAGTFLNLGQNYLFYETAATIITLVLLGNLLEKRSVRQTTTAIRELTKIREAKAKKIVGEDIVEIDYKEVKSGDILVVNTGDKIPVDGIIVQGEASINESMLTGESIPVEKFTGREVYGGTLIDQGGIQMKAVSVGNNTMIAQIIELVKNAHASKPAIQKLGDKISAIFVPIVLGIALLTFILSYFIFDLEMQRAVMSSIAVLVISCPCAMGLATPTAVMVGIGRAARQGILIKGGSTLEEFSPVKTIIFDKTGTLTNGDFKIRQMHVSGEDETKAKQVLFKLEQHSSHPLARSIEKELKAFSTDLVLYEIREEKGLGIHGREGEILYYAGSYNIARHLTKDDTHDIYLLRNDTLWATVDLEDELKPNAAETIKQLKEWGIRTVLLSGDKLSKCQYIAEQTGIDEVYAQKLPHEKLEIIEKFSASGKVAMVGDGINDAPALAKATVGISLGNASQAAIHSASIILLNGDLSSLTKALAISRHTLLTIKQNLFWAFFYNVVAIPVAAVGLLSPMIGALAMAFSDVIVIGNSIRLKTKKIFS